MFIVGKSFFSKTLSKLKIKTYISDSKTSNDLYSKGGCIKSVYSSATIASG